MTKLEFIVDLNKKGLTVDNKNLKLDDSLFFSGIEIPSDNDDPKTIELEYSNRTNPLIGEDERTRVYNFLKENGILGEMEIKVNANKCVSYVLLVGDFNATVKYK